MSDVILAIDFGEKRIGVAVTDELCITAQPLDVLSIQDVFNKIPEICVEKNVSKIIIGMPLNAEGQEGFAAKKVIAFRKRLEKRLVKISWNGSIEYWDEAFTTEQAQSWLREAGVSGKKRKKVIDKLAAVAILESYLSEKFV